MPKAAVPAALPADDAMIPFVAFDREYAECQDEILHAIDRCGRAGQLILGEEVERFEAEVARRANQRWAVAVGSGYDALYLACRLVAEREHRHGGIAVPSYRHVSADNAISNAGFVPTDRDPFVPSAEQQPYQPTAYMPVHMEGVVGPRIDTSLPVIEDACQAFGAQGLGFADLTCFSFHPMKVLGAMGDGGAVAGSDPVLRERLLALRHHGERGVNSRLDAIQAAILNVKLRYLDRWLARRATLAQWYTAAYAFPRIAHLCLPPHTPGRVWSSYVLQLDTAAGLARHLLANGVISSIIDPGRLALPLYPQLTDDEQTQVIDAVIAFFAKGRA